MIRIYSGGDKISCTCGDTFLLNVESADGFEEGAQMKFQVAENEESDLLIDCIYELKDGVFQIQLTNEEIEKLALGSYVYKLILLGADGNIVTQKSGELEVKWGA